MPRRLVLASSNRGKLAEFAQLLGPYRVTVLPQSQFVAEGAEESGSTFLENALRKARFAAQAAGLPAIADDSGLEVDALQGAPGVFSARYAGPEASDAANNAKLLAALADEAERSARFRCLLVYIRNAVDPNPIVAEGVWQGRIAMEVRGAGGFGYDPLFLPNDAQCSAADLGVLKKNAQSHRGTALRLLVEKMSAAGELM